MNVSKSEPLKQVPLAALVPICLMIIMVASTGGFVAGLSAAPKTVTRNVTVLAPAQPLKITDIASGILIEDLPTGCVWVKDGWGTHILRGDSDQCAKSPVAARR